MLINAHAFAEPQWNRKWEAIPISFSQARFCVHVLQQSNFWSSFLVSKTKSAESHRMDISTWWIYSEKSSLLIATFGNYLLKELFHPKMKICWTCTPSGHPMCWWVCFFIVTDLEKFSISSLALQWTGVMWITCRLLWCFYQLFGLSFWRHPFTAEDPLVSKWL